MKKPYYRQRTDADKCWLPPEQLAGEIQIFKRGGEASPTLLSYLYGIADRVLSSRRFHNYQFDIKEDMRQEMVLKEWKNLKNLKEGKEKSFYGYLHLCCYCAGITFLKNKHYKQMNIKSRLIEDFKIFCEEENIKCDFETYKPDFENEN